MEKIFNQKNFNNFVWSPLGSRGNIYINFCLQVHFQVSAVWYCSHYLPPVSMTPVANLPPVSLIPVSLSGAWGKVIHEKNRKQKISWHCPFKQLRLCCTGTYTVQYCSFGIGDHHVQIFSVQENSGPEFANLLRSPGIDSQPGWPVRQPCNWPTGPPGYIDYRLTEQIPGLL